MTYTAGSRESVGGRSTGQGTDAARRKLLSAPPTETTCPIDSPSTLTECRGSLSRQGPEIPFRVCRRTVTFSGSRRDVRRNRDAGTRVAGIQPGVVKTVGEGMAVV